ncbi:MAG: CinA family protein [Hyphomicrobiaceae bacterium]
MFPSYVLREAEDLIALLRLQGKMIATAESCTGGLIIGALTEIAGSSDVVERGYVTYSNAAKSACLGVCQDLLADCGAVSQRVAVAMAAGAVRYSEACVAVSVTGIAGPGGGSQEKPVGLVHIAAICGQHDPLHQEHRFGEIGRAEIRLKTVTAALMLARSALTR